MKKRVNDLNEKIKEHAKNREILHYLGYSDIKEPRPKCGPCYRNGQRVEM